MKFYNFPEARWFDFGLNLGLLHPTLEAIEYVHKGDPSRFLMECLTKWLNKVDKTVHSLTWQTLANAARGMNAIAVADNIQKTSKVPILTDYYILYLILIVVDPASQLLQHYSSRISLAILSEESVDLLHTEGLISVETLVQVKSCGCSLLDDTIREIYTAVSDDHNKLRAFANILFKTKDTISIANELLNDCGEYTRTKA